MSLLTDLLHHVVATLVRYLPILLLGAGLASFIQVYVDRYRLQDWLLKRSAVSIPATVIFGTLTPFCACGTMAVILAMLAGTMPWAPIMAFLTSSPLMGPTNFVLLYGIVGSGFATAVVFASVLTGLTAGYATYLIDRKTSFLQNQLRFQQADQTPDPCCLQKAEAGSNHDHLSKQEEPNNPSSSFADQASEKETQKKEPGCRTSCENDPQPSNSQFTPISDSLNTSRKEGQLMALIKNMFQISIVRILPLFISLTAIGFLVNRLVPSEIITAWFGGQSLIGVPIASFVGLPLYVSGESAVPLIRSLLESGASPGAMLAFMIAGSGTSAAVIAGVSAIMKKRAIVLYVGYILGAALLFGYGYDAFLLMTP